jgi:hypothetical protein
MTAAAVARIVIEAMEAERFLILSHPTARDNEQRKTRDRDRWLAGWKLSALHCVR